MPLRSTFPFIYCGNSGDWSVVFVFVAYFAFGSRYVTPSLSQVFRVFFNASETNFVIIWCVKDKWWSQKFVILSIPANFHLRVRPSVYINSSIAIFCIFVVHYFYNCLLCFQSTLLFYSNNSLARSGYLSFFFFFSLSFNFTLWSAGMAKSTIQQIPFLNFFLTIIRSGRLAEVRWFVWISKCQRSLCVSFSRKDSGLCIYYMFVWSNLNFLHNSKLITFPTQSCLILYSFCDRLLHSLFIWLIVSSLSPFNLHLLFCCLFFLWNSSSLWHCSVLVLEEIQFLS